MIWQIKCGVFIKYLSYCITLCATHFPYVVVPITLHLLKLSSVFIKNSAELAVLSFTNKIIDANVGKKEHFFNIWI